LERLYRCALEGRQKILGKEHLDTLMSAKNLVDLLEAKGEYIEANGFFGAFR
jgi:hypothetical protein